MVECDVRETRRIARNLVIRAAAVHGLEYVYRTSDNPNLFRESQESVYDYLVFVHGGPFWVWQKSTYLGFDHFYTAHLDEATLPLININLPGAEPGQNTIRIPKTIVDIAVPAIVGPTADSAAGLAAALVKTVIAQREEPNGDVIVTIPPFHVPDLIDSRVLQTMIAVFKLHYPESGYPAVSPFSR